MVQALKNSSVEDLGFLQEEKSKTTTTSFIVRMDQIKALQEREESNSEFVRKAIDKALEIKEGEA